MRFGANSSFCVLMPFVRCQFARKSSTTSIRWTVESSKPSKSQRISCSDRSIASVSFRGQRNTPLSSRLYRSRKPSPSHKSPLFRSRRRPQNRYKLLLNRSKDSVPCTTAASPSMPFRRSL